MIDASSPIRAGRLANVSFLLVLLIAAASTVAVPARAFAQAESGASAVAGSLVDPDGRAVAKARITIRNTETGYTRTVTTDDVGRFRLAPLPVGTYQVETTVAGFAPLSLPGVQLRVGESPSVALTLTVANVAEAVSVTASPMLLDTAGQSSGTNIPLKAIDDLPIRGRAFPEFAQLTPALIQESDRAGMVISGQRSINSNVAIDGADFNDPLQGNQRGGNEAVFFFPQSAVNEFQVVRSGAGAEVGRTSAGFVNVVTKSGTNKTRGDAFYFNRNKSLTSADAFDQKLNNQQNQFGGSGGGPLRQDKAFFFVALEQNLLRVPFVVKFNQQAAGVVVPDSLKALEGEKFGTNNPTAFFGRSDFELSGSQRLNLQYTFSRLSGKNFNFDSPQQSTAESANYTRRNSSNGLKGAWQSLLGSAMVNEAKAQVATDNREENPNVNAPQIVITGFGTLGGDAGRPRVFRNTRTQVSDNLTLVRGRHDVRAGIDINVTYAEQERESNTLGRFDYTSLANYVNGVVSRYRQTVPGFDPKDLVYTGTQKEVGVYLQDKLQFTDMTLTAGLRWDGQWNPQPTKPNPALASISTIPNDLKMWQPRLGLAWNVKGRASSVVRASAGLYSARTPANLFQRVFTDNGISTVAIDSRTDSRILGWVSNGQALQTLPAGTVIPLQRVFGFDPAFQNPTTFQAAVSLDQQISNRTLVSLGYIHAHTSNLQRRLDKNLLPPTPNEFGLPIYPASRPNTAFAQIEVNESLAKSNYEALVLTGTERLGRLYSQINYTFAINKDDDSNERNFSRETIQNVFDPGSEYAYSKQDVRHSFNISSVLDLGRGLTFGGILIGRSGFPYTAVIGSDQQRDANDDNDRAIINGRVTDRNAFRQPSFFNLDLRLSKAFRFGGQRLDVIAEVFNATRASNMSYGNDSISIYGTPAAPVATAGQALFAPSTARFGGARQMQLGARLTF